VLELVLPDQTRLPLVDGLTIGRGPGNTVRLGDPSVSRVHARIAASGEGALLEDAGSSYGTWLDDRRIVAPAPLREGSRIRVGNQQLMVDRPRGDDEAGMTIVVPETGDAPAGGPRLRSGYALKRHEEGEGRRRWVLEDRRSDRLLRLEDADAQLLLLLDGRPTEQLQREAARRLGHEGPARLSRLVASLAARGLLTGSDDERRASSGRLGRALAPRQLAWRGADALFARLYRHGGRRLVGRAAVAPLAVLVVSGLAVFAYLVAGRYGTPFVVARKVGIGALVFIVGRLAVAALHETAHGLVLKSFGRPIREAGLKLVLIFPYVYVDTSSAWFEPARRRLAVSAAGPASDLCLGAVFAFCCLAAPLGPIRDICFQLAFGAYLVAFLNLNPLVERDGYHILVDVLREPNLRRRARVELRQRILGEPGSGSTVLRRYALLGLAWSVLGASVAVAMTLRYEPRLARLAPPVVVWPVMLALWGALFVPVAVAVVPPLRERRRARAR
jgi:putative peptide zinc metalloprotease protein